MANGFAPYLLAHTKQVFEGATPSEKVTPTGFLQMLTNNAARAKSMVNVGSGPEGHTREFRIKYQTRGREIDIVDTDDCDIEIVPTYMEDTVTLDHFSKVGIFIDDATMAQYLRDASRTLRVGKPATPLMRELMETVVRKLNGFFQKVDDNLLGDMAALFGNNVRTGNNAADTLNFSKDRSVRSLADGMARVLTDYQNNEMHGTPAIVGDGLFHEYQMEQVAKSADNLGVDTSKYLPAYNFYFDPKVTSKWGSNNIGVFEPNSSLLLEYNKFEGDFAGDKGVSQFFTWTPPLVDTLGSRHLSMFKLDCQLKYIDCAENRNVGYDDVDTEIGRGYILLISKTYGLHNIPSDAYEADDRLTGNRGNLRYEVTNTCEAC